MSLVMDAVVAHVVYDRRLNHNCKRDFEGTDRILPYAMQNLVLTTDCSNASVPMQE